MTWSFNLVIFKFHQKYELVLGLGRGAQYEENLHHSCETRGHLCFLFLAFLSFLSWVFKTQGTSAVFHRPWAADFNGLFRTFYFLAKVTIRTAHGRRGCNLAEGWCPDTGKMPAQVCWSCSALEAWVGATVGRSGGDRRKTKGTQGAQKGSIEAEEVTVDPCGMSWEP